MPDDTLGGALFGAPILAYVERSDPRHEGMKGRQR